MTALLSVRDVRLRFGGIVALDGVSFDVAAGTVTGLIGPNGAGKTTAFNVVTRVYTPDSGEVELDGPRCSLSPPTTRATGVSRTFQNINLFRSMSVARERPRRRPLARTLRRASAEAMAALARVGLEGAATRPAASLPYGIQKRVEIARALVSRPRLLLLDEPAGGLNHDGGRGARRPRPPAPRRSRPDDPPRRAPHGSRDAHLGRRHRPQLRPDDRERAAGRGAGGPGRDRGVPRSLEHDGAAPRARASRPGTAPSRRSTASRSSVGEGEIVAVLGANGAGKTTTLRAVSGHGAADRRDPPRRRPAPRRPRGRRAGGRRPRAGGARHVHRALASPRTSASAGYVRRGSLAAEIDAHGASGSPGSSSAATSAPGRSRGRAADARPRPGADRAPAAADARRAVARARAADRQGDLPHRARAERAGGAERAARRAGRAHRARRRRPRVRARGRHGRRSRAPSAELRENDDVRRSYLGY